MSRYLICLGLFFLCFFSWSESSCVVELEKIESDSEGRLGVFAVNIENGHVVKYRSDEAFPTGCTSKVIGVAAVLKKSMSNPTLLSQHVKYSEEDLGFGRWNPVTQKHLSEGMTVQELCSAAITVSDNTAMNLLLKFIGGVQGMNIFARSMGDTVFRQDNDWPAEAYSGGRGNLADASTPRAMVESLRQLTLGEVLDESQRDLLIAWLIETKTGSARIRSATPKDWRLGHKTGTGLYGTTNDLAIVFPPNHSPILIGVYYTSDEYNSARREDLIALASKVVIKEFASGDSALTLCDF